MNDRTRDPEAYLTRHREALRSRGGGVPGDHLDDERLASALESGAVLRVEEVAHLAACADCRSVFAELGRELELPGAAPVIPLFRRRSLWAAASAVAAVAAVLLFAIVVPREPAPDRFQARGLSTSIEQPERSEVAVVATDASGARRELKDGARVSLGDRLGFRYGNTGGAHRALAVLGWNGGKVHWYYPEHEGGTPVALRSGDDARAVRLPFDIALAEQHVAGPLRIVAGFDLDPRAIAAALEGGEELRGLGDVRVFELEVAR